MSPTPGAFGAGCERTLFLSGPIRSTVNTMRVRPWVPIVSIQLHLSAVAMGAAPVIPLDLKYEAPEDCPRLETFSAAVSRLVGSGADLTRSVTATVVVRREKEHEFVLTLLTELDGIPGERELRGRSCDSVADAAAVTLALLLNPNAEMDADSAQPAPTTASQPTQRDLGMSERSGHAAPSSAAPLRRALGQAPPTERRAMNPPLQLVAGGSVGLHMGVMPVPGPELSLVAGVRYDHWSALGSVSYAPPEEVHLPGQDRIGGRLWHGTLMALACGAVAVEPPRVGACLGAAYTLVRGRGIGITDIRQGTTDWVSPTAGVFADLTLTHRVALRTSAMLLVPANRPDAHLDNLGTVQRPGLLTAKLHAGVIVHIP